MNRLLTIPFSHFCEKARWALQRFGVAFREEPYLPLLHMAPVAVATRLGVHGRADGASTRLSTPVLVTAEGQRLCDSSLIVRWASDRHAPPGFDLYPSAEVARIEARLGERLGPHVRRWAYGALFSHEPLARAMVAANASPRQNAVFQVGYPVARAALVRALGVTPARVERSLSVMRDEFAWASELLASRPFLAGERFTAADLAFAALAAPALAITHEEGHPSRLPAASELPPSATAVVAELRATRGGAHALSLYATERAHVKA
jgi:glutathione S-transferase